MMAPDYAHWHGMYEVAERFYQELIPEAREMADHAEESGNADGAAAVRKVIDAILARPEHEWFEKDKIDLTKKVNTEKVNEEDSSEASSETEADSG
jgi:hypothetical protein